jgi:hypothetical protein
LRTGAILQEYCSAADAAHKLGVNPCTINHVLQGRAPHIKGHKFRYQLDGDVYKRGPKAVLLINPESGEVTALLPPRQTHRR